MQTHILDATLAADGRYHVVAPPTLDAHVCALLSQLGTMPPRSYGYAHTLQEPRTLTPEDHAQCSASTLTALGVA